MCMMSAGDGCDSAEVQIAEHDFKCWLPGGLHNHWNFVRMTFRTPAELKAALSNLGGSPDALRFVTACLAKA